MNWSCCHKIVAWKSFSEYKFNDMFLGHVEERVIDRIDGQS